MKTILVPYYGREAAGRALDTALMVAERFGSYVEGLFVRQLPPIIAGEGITLPGDYMTQLAEEGRQLARRAREQFREDVEKRGLAFAAEGDAPARQPCAGWHDVEGIESQVVGDYGRAFDLVVVGRAEPAGGVDWKATCEAALFESGRPVIVAGERVPERLGRNVMVAWNGSTETARTLAMSAAFLDGAESVVVLTVEGGTVPGPTGELVAEHLRRGDVNATARLVQAEGRSIGRTILDEAAAHDVDLLIKGAFTHSRLRQMIFGGATSEIFADATLPVLSAH